MRNYIIPFSYLSIFINPFLQSGKVVTFNITVPMLGNLELCQFSIESEGPSVHNIIRHGLYSGELKAILNKGRHSYLLDEIPEYSHFQDAFFQGSVLKPSGLDVLKGYISAASTQSVIRGGDVFYIAFDTNVLRDRIYTNHLREYSDAPNIDFILSDTVRSELKNRRKKMHRKMANALSGIVGNSGYNFINQNVLADRLRYIGFLEYNRIRHETDCDQLIPERVSSNKDEEIIQSYAAFAVAEHNRKVLLISRDNEFIRMSPSLPDIIPIPVEHQFPARISRPVQCAYSELYTFIYHLSVIYGRVDINLNRHRLYECSGVWSRKNAGQWENDYIKISANNKLPFLETLDRHVAILQNMRYRKEHSRFPKINE
jgi:hypothetical protein